MTPATTTLVDARNFDAIAPLIVGKMQAATLVGFDIETCDPDRHEGLNRFMKADAEGRKSKARPLVFDVNRTTVTGFSLFVDGDTVAYYINLNHADVENRVPWVKARTLLDAMSEKGCWVAHNAAFERVMMLKSLGWSPKNTVICTMQMAVSAYSPDEYEPTHFMQLSTKPIIHLIQEAATTFALYEPNKEMTGPQGELFAKFVGKESDSAHSYNGWVDTVSRPYDLKRCVMYWFGYQMQTFEETLDGEVHMGNLTGEQVSDYGASDSFWCTTLYHRLLQHMLSTNPASVKVFFEQELPCVEYYADVWAKGMVINKEAVNTYRISERAGYAQTLRNLKAAVKALLPFDPEPHEGLIKYDTSVQWYTKGFAKYRAGLAKWATTPDDADDFAESQRVRGSISNAWAADVGVPESSGLSIGHYMPVRVMFYDLLREKVIIDKGKVQSDAECRGKMITRLEKKLRDEPDNLRLKAGLDMLRALGSIASYEQRAKLYLNPYSQLVDPETDRVYPIISSKLASRRTSISNPNGQQLAKKGDSTYIRGFYLPDHEDHVILSEDWSGIELVLIGEFSQDPEFRKAFGQLPYADLHLGAAASCLSVQWGDEVYHRLEKATTFGDKYGLSDADLKDEVTAMEFLLRTLKRADNADVADFFPKILVNLKGEPMEPAKALKFWRGTDCGKGANFGYWYSGALSDVAQRLGWTSDQMWKAVEKYRDRFAVAEQWRMDTIGFAQQHGYVQLPDGHRRSRFEATMTWLDLFLRKFEAYQGDGVAKFARAAAKAIQRRANNQAVNSMIQGSCATMMKRSILRVRKAIADKGWTDRECRVLIPIHDELLLSVHKDLVVEAIKLVRDAMCEPDIVTTLPLTVAPAIGRTFEPWAGKGRMGQIELAELSAVPCVGKNRWGQEATDDEVRAVVNWIFETELKEAA